VNEDGQRAGSMARDALAAILLKRRACMINALEESGYRSTLVTQVHDVEFDRSRELVIERSFTGLRSALASDQIRQYFECHVLDLTFPDEDELHATNNIIRSLGKNFHQPWYHVPPDDDTDPAVVLFQTLVWPLSDYFISLDTTAENAYRAAKSLATETILAISTGRGNVIERTALNSVAVDNPITVDRITIRPLTPGERSGIAANIHRGSMYDIQLVGPDHNSGVRGNYLLEARTPWNITEAPPESPFLVDRTVLALQLLGVATSGPGWVHTSTNPRNTVLDTLRPLPLHPRAPVTILDAALVEHATRLAEQIPERAVTNPMSRQEIALNRFLRGCAAPSPSDALLEHTIALEAILLPSKFEGELGYRLRVNAAWLLGTDKESRIQIAHKLSRIYALRSTLVHGLKAPRHNEVQETASIAQQIVCRILYNCLEVGWPSEADLAHLAFGRGCDAGVRGDPV